MLATCPGPDVPAPRPRRRRLALVAPPVRFSRAELVDLLREYRIHPDLSTEQRHEAVAWIVGHQHGGA